MHAKKSNYRLKKIDMDFAKEVNCKLNIILVPGKLLCQKCCDDLKTDLTRYDDMQKLSQNLSASSLNSSPISSLKSSESYTCIPLQTEAIDGILDCLNLSPVKVEDYQSDRYQKKLKRKLELINTKVETCLRKKLKLDDSSTLYHKISTSESQKYRLLVSQLQEKFNSSDRPTKVQILTLFAEILQVSEIEELFNTTYMIRQAIILKKKGILSKPDSYSVHRIEK